MLVRLYADHCCCGIVVGCSGCLGELYLVLLWGICVRLRCGGVLGGVAFCYVF